MFIRKIVSAALFLVFAAGVCPGQDLNRLQNRAQKLLDLRSSINFDKRLAAQYVEAPKRQEVIESTPLPMRDAHVTGIEFTPDPKLVYVVFNAKVVLPDIGAVPRTGRESWVWDKREWFLRIEDTGSFLDLARNVRVMPAAPVVPFEFSPKQIDLGKHVQGEVVKGTIEIKSDRDLLLSLRAPDLLGLSFSAPIWKSKQEAQIEFELDTTLMSEDVRYVAQFLADGHYEQTTEAELEVVAQIEPRLRITQQPPIIEPGKATPVQIRIENLTNTPFSFKNVFMTSGAYSLVKEPTETVNPGQTATFIFLHAAQPEALGAQLILELSPSMLGKRRFSVPLKIKLPDPPVVGFSREQLEEIIKRNKQ